MNEFIIILLLLVVAALIGGFFLLFRRLAALESGGGTDDQVQKMMLDLIENLRKEVNQTGHQNRQELQARLDQMTQLLQKSHTHQAQSMQTHFDGTTKIIASYLTVYPCQWQIYALVKGWVL